ncbi:MAG: hypothetical protein HEQ39_07490 [Rhizobacter sp.]
MAKPVKVVGDGGEFATRPHLVIPAQAGIQCVVLDEPVDGVRCSPWIPACAKNDGVRDDHDASIGISHPAFCGFSWMRDTASAHHATAL